MNAKYTASLAVSVGVLATLVGYLLGGWFTAGMCWCFCGGAGMYGYFFQLNDKPRRRWIMGGPWLLIMTLGIFSVASGPSWGADYPYFMQALGFALLLGGTVGFLKGRYDWRTYGARWRHEEAEWLAEFEQKVATDRRTALDIARAQGVKEAWKFRAPTTEQLRRMMEDEIRLLEWVYHKRS